MSQTADLCSFLAEHYHEDIADLVEHYPEEGHQSLSVSWDDLNRFDPARAESFLDGSTEAMEYLEEALFRYDRDGVVMEDVARVPVRIHDLPESSTYSVGGHYAGSPDNSVMKFVAIRGQVTKRSTVDPKVEVAVWRCKCGHTKPVEQGFGRMREPMYCPGCETTTTPWWEVRERHTWTDYQKLRLQQLPDEIGKGETETIDAHLTGELARRGVESGQQVTMVAKYVPYSPKNTTVHKKGLDVLQVTVDRGKGGVDVEAHREVIDDLASQHDPFSDLIASVAPHHFGDDHIKESVILQLVRANSLDGSEGKSYRGNVHIFLLGDPGAGKTDFGEALVALSPRSQKASGNGGTSAAGLTAAMTKDDFSDSEWTIEAGAIPHCSGGAVFIDELDSAGTDEQNAMLEAMESQVINISKGGEKATLEADTAILAAGNPDSGHFEEGVPPAEQTSVVSPLLDRFDLLFCPRERTAREEIDAIGGHIIDDKDAATRQARGLDVEPEMLASVEPLIDPDELRAYLSVCRELTPVFANEAVKDALRNWYVETKTRLVAREEEEGRVIPVTPRTQQDVVRLAEASAKARHSETIEMVDAERATRLKSQSFRELGLDPGPDVEVKTDESGEQIVSTTSTPTAAIVEAVEELKMVGSQYGAAREDVVAAAVEDRTDLDADRAEELIEQMLAAEELVEPTSGRLTV